MHACTMTPFLAIAMVACLPATVTGTEQRSANTTQASTKLSISQQVMSTKTESSTQMSEVASSVLVTATPYHTPTGNSPFHVSVCPLPTGASAPLDPKSNLTFGCKPGYVCDPPKPDGCNFWPGPPSDDFICCPDDCIPAPPFETATWAENQTEYYPPSDGYFNLNPEAFGLPYDIFAYEIRTETNDGKALPHKTGNWASQPALSTWPKTEAAALPAELKDGGKWPNQFKMRAVAPPVCYDDCNNAYLGASGEGKTDNLCKPDSPFNKKYGKCSSCISNNEDVGKNSIDAYVKPTFSQFLNFCSGRDSTPISGVPTVPDSALTSQPDVKTSGQVDGSLRSFTPIEPPLTGGVSRSGSSSNAQSPSSAGNSESLSSSGNRESINSVGHSGQGTAGTETNPGSDSEASTRASLPTGISAGGDGTSPESTTNEEQSDGLDTQTPSSASSGKDSGMGKGKSDGTIQNGAEPASNGASETNATQMPGGASSGETNHGETETLPGEPSSSRETPPTVMNAPASSVRFGHSAIEVVCALGLLLVL